MTSSTRRGAIGGVLGLGLTLGCSAGLGLSSAAAFAQTPAARVAIPARPMRFCRRLERSLSGGAKLVVSRDWRIQFASQGQGIGITGVQLHAEVDAPETLASLA